MCVCVCVGLLRIVGIYVCVFLSLWDMCLSILLAQGLLTCAIRATPSSITYNDAYVKEEV